MSLPSARDGARTALLRLAREAAYAAQPLPGEHELARRLGITRGQLRVLLAELEQHGILRRQQGAPTLVDPVALGLATRLEDQLEYSVLLQRMGYTPSVQLVDAEVAPLPPEWVSAPGAPVARESLRIVKRWLADGVPAMVAENHLALPAGESARELRESLSEAELADSLFALARRVWTQPVIWEIARPGARLAGERTAQLLGCDAGDAVLTLQNVGVAHDGTRVYLASEAHRPDAVHYTVVRSFAQPWNAGLG